MPRPKTLPAFTAEQQIIAHELLATRVAFMMGRQFEEDDWAEVYCRAKGIQKRGWSNLKIDVMHGSFGVEHKRIRAKSKGDIRDCCGKSIMHPSATRSIRVPPSTTDPAVAMRDVLTQYGELIQNRTEQVKLASGSATSPDMRTGWLIWQDSLRQFLYFEEEWTIPNPDDYKAEWVQHAGGGARKPSTNLWVIEKQTDRKRYSITSDAGPKIQPYFDVPPVTDPNLYTFTVIGEAIRTGRIRVWITDSTHRDLKRLLGALTTESLSAAVMKTAGILKRLDPIEEARHEHAAPFEITVAAYQELTTALPGKNDDHCFQLLVQHLSQNGLSA